MKDNSILLIGALGIVGFGLLNSGFFKGIGKIGDAVGDTVGDLGGSIGQIGGNIADLSDPSGAIGQNLGLTIDQLGEQNRSLMDDVYDASKNIILDNKVLRITDRQQTATAIQDNLTNWAEKSLTIPTYNPKNILSNFINTVKKFTPAITGLSIGGSSDVRNLKNTTNKINPTINSTINTTTNLNNARRLWENLGYQGQSTTSGVVWTKPTLKNWF